MADGKKQQYIESAQAIARDGWCLATDKHGDIKCRNCPAFVETDPSCQAGRESHCQFGPNSAFAQWFTTWLDKNEDTLYTAHTNIDTETVERILRQGDCEGILCSDCVCHRTPMVNGVSCFGKGQSRSLPLSQMGRECLTAWLVKAKANSPDTTPRMFNGLRVVTEPVIGARVVRGPDWKWGDQDGGEGSIGTLCVPDGPHDSVWYQVQWDKSRRFGYRIDPEQNIFDLCYAPEPDKKTEREIVALKAMAVPGTAISLDVLHSAALGLMSFGQPKRLTYTQKRIDLRRRFMGRVK